MMLDTRGGTLMSEQVQNDLLLRHGPGRLSFKLEQAHQPGEM